MKGEIVVKKGDFVTARLLGCRNDDCLRQGVVDRVYSDWAMIKTQGGRAHPVDLEEITIVDPADLYGRTRDFALANRPIRCGDHILLETEKLVVGWADYETNTIAWLGWPSGTCQITSVTLVYPCTDEEHRRQVLECLKSTNSHLAQKVKQLYVRDTPSQR